MASGSDTPKKILLDESELPTQWYNVIPDLPAPPPPPLHPGTQEPIGPDDLAPLFPMALIMQEVSTERYIDIPDEVRDILEHGAEDAREGARAFAEKRDPNWSGT